MYAILTCEHREPLSNNCYLLQTSCFKVVLFCSLTAFYRTILFTTVKRFYFLVFKIATVIFSRVECLWLIMVIYLAVSTIVQWLDFSCLQELLSLCNWRPGGTLIYYDRSQKNYFCNLPREDNGNDNETPFS